jgi:hypothetical protein
MPDKFNAGKYDLLITPLDEEGNRTKNDPATANPPQEIDPPDPMGHMHGLDKGNRLAKDGKARRDRS